MLYHELLMKSGMLCLKLFIRNGTLAVKKYDCLS